MNPSAISFGVMIPRRRPLLPTIKELYEQGITSVQIWCLDNALDVREEGAARAADEVMQAAGEARIAIRSLCCDNGQGLVTPARLDEQLRMFGAAADLCQRMGVGILTSHIGAFWDDRKPIAQSLVDTLRGLGDACAARGVTFATETGVESGPQLWALLQKVDHPHVRVNFDPANLVRRGFDLEEAVRLLGPYIVHAHAKDGVRHGGEVVIGHGDVPWKEYLRWLAAIDCQGPTVIEREAYDSWLADVMEGKRFLDSASLASQPVHA